ncbi:hypothetical protein BgAZ_400050 [Babesia gibsoni]|uniref:Uncharacterized protein n=1 Tax=Babesia gibsoni TaxID=33632 RepID=A0AAD8P7W7_BABGI|nr:hypothetical protein BgAZ_400050 [Babesia gibsoni]
MHMVYRRCLLCGMPSSFLQKRLYYGTLGRHTVTSSIWQYYSTDHGRIGKVLSHVRTTSTSKASNLESINDVTDICGASVGLEDAESVFESTLERAVSESDGHSIVLLRDAVELMIRGKLQIQERHLERLLYLATKDNTENQHLLLNAIYMLLIGHDGMITAPSIGHLTTILEHLSTSTDHAQQLEGINIYHVLSKRHNYVIPKLAKRHICYLEYIRQMSHHIRVKVPTENDTPEVIEIRKLMSTLGLENYGAISGHLYLPLVIGGTNMAIEILAERDLCYGSEDKSPITLQ